MTREKTKASAFHLRMVAAQLRDSFNAVAWSPDGKLIASGSDDHTIRIWDPDSGRNLRTLEGHTGTVLSVSWSRDGKALASGSADHTINLWDPTSGKLLQHLEGHRASVLSVSWSSDGEALASGSADQTISIWDPASGKPLRHLEGHRASVLSVSWSEDAKTLASGSEDNTISIWDPISGRHLRHLEGHRDPVLSVSWSSDGQAIASGSGDKTVRIWDPASGKHLRSLEGHRGMVRSVSWSADGKAIASGSDDKTVRIWDPASGKHLRRLEGHRTSVLSVSWSVDGKAIASGSDDKTVRVWDPETGKLLRTLEGHGTAGLSVSWSADGKALASGSDDNVVSIWNPKSGKPLRSLEAHSAPVLSVSWSVDGKALASGSSDNTVRIWDPNSGEQQRCLEGHGAPVLSVSWSADGKALASGSSDNTVRIWDPASGKLVRILEGHRAGIRCVSWSADGKAVASGSDDDTIRIWDPASGKLVRTLEGHRSMVLSVSWSPDGRAIASGSDDKTIRIWNAALGKLVRTLEGHRAGVRSVSWSPDGKAIASGSDDNTVRLWKPDLGTVLRVLKDVFRPTHILVDLAFRRMDSLCPICRTATTRDPELLLSAVDDFSDVASTEITTFVTSAKIVLVGESNVGKSYLAHRIATGHVPDTGSIKSTHGMKFWPLELERIYSDAQTPAGQRRDVVLWDMGGQEEYRLVHQLFLDDTSVALLLLDPSRGSTAFREVETWNKYLVKQLRERKAIKLLVGAKLDEPTGTLDRKALEQLRKDGDFASFHETSAITGRGVDDLCRAVGKAIRWEKITRPALFQKIRDEIEVQRKRGEVVLHLADLHRALGEQAESEDQQRSISTVVDQLAKQGMIARSRMATGEQVLVLQIQEIERHAGSIILAARSNPRGVPALELRAIPQPDFGLPGISPKDRLPRAQEKAVLDCTVELLLEHGICFKHEGLLVFPSLFATGLAGDSGSTPLSHAVSLCYDFAGAIENIYASLVAWLVLARDFGRLRLSQDCAEFEVKDGGLCGLRKVARPGGFAHVDVYFEDRTPVSRCDEFISFVEDHLRSHGVQLVERIEIQCSCGHAFAEEVLRQRIARGDRDIGCPLCDLRHSLHEGATEARKRNPASAYRLWGLKTDIERSRQQVAREAIRTLDLAGSVPSASRPIRLLHLSDLHFNEGTYVRARLDWLINDLRQDTGLSFTELDYLVVSGDLTDRGCLEGFEKAYEFLSELTSVFNLSAERCILVPGNHDLAEPIDAFVRRRDTRGLRDGEWIQRDNIVFARDPDKYPLRFKPFSDSLHHKFLQRAYPMDVKEQGIAIPFWDTGIQFLTLNSCWEIDEFNHRRAGVHPEAVATAIRQAQKQVDDARKSGEIALERPILRIGVWHHSITAPDYKMKDMQFLGNLQKSGVKVALHGDVHEARLDSINYTKKLHIVGAGSFGAWWRDRPESIPRLYNVLEIERDFSSIKVHTRQQRTPDGNWDGWHEWPDPKGGDGRVAYYTIGL